MSDLETQLRAGLTDVAERVPVAPDAWATYRARRPRRVQRRRLNLALATGGIAVVTAGIVIGAFALTSGGPSRIASTGPPPPGESVTLTPSHHLTHGEIQAAVSVLRVRLSALDADGVTLSTAGNHLTASGSPSDIAKVRAAARTQGTLSFRQALAFGASEGKAPAGHHAKPVYAAPMLTRQLTDTYDHYRCSNGVAPTHGTAPASDLIVACSTDGTSKYLLNSTSVVGADVTSASAGVSPEDSAWLVNISFSRASASAWQNLTKAAYDVNQGRPSTTCSPPTGCNSVAIVLDGAVIEAPYLSQPGGIAGGRAQISGDFNQAKADQLAAILKSGALPTTFRVSRAH